MNLLILGGTKFVGRHITADALERGHRVTLFNRGVTNAELFPSAEKITGDRDGGLDALRGREWDAVIDVNGYLPRVVAQSAQLLANRVARYIFISTISVYADFTRIGQNEDAPLATVQDATTEIIDGDTYGGLKVLCEQLVQNACPERALVIRPGYVVGPHDHTDRWTSWLRRVARGGDMLAPVRPDAPVQFIDGRDLAAFTISMAETRGTGIFNATGPAEPLTWSQLFETARRVTRADTTFTWVPLDFLRAQGVDEEQLPMVQPPEWDGGMTADCSRARAAGLRYRLLADTIRDTLEWDAAYGKPKFGLPPEQEAQLLEKWRAPQNNT